MRFGWCGKVALVAPTPFYARAHHLSFFSYSHWGIKSTMMIICLNGRLIFSINFYADAYASHTAGYVCKLYCREGIEIANAIRMCTLVVLGWWS